MAASKVWNFVLPGSGAHQLRVQDLGSPGQLTFIDGQQQTAREALVFTGPDNSLLEVRCMDKNRWVLLVNGCMVEDYSPSKRASGDESFRELRGKPDGSYLISPSFEITAEIEPHVVRRYVFRVGRRLHEVQVAHADCIWQVVLNSQLIARESHRRTDSSGEVSFSVEAFPGHGIPGTVRMSWVTREMKWHYVLTVNGIDIPASYIKGQDEIEIEPPVVLTEAEVKAMAPVIIAHSDTLEQLPQPYELSMPVTLPQGVAFDEAAGTFCANIRNHAGKFVFLGAFATAEEAHQKYLEAVPIHCPEKHIAPSLPA